MGLSAKIAVYPGTFDPITNGHVDVVKRALKIFDKVIILVAERKEKNPFFSLQERVEIVKEIFKEEKRVEVDVLQGLLVDYLRSHGLNTVIRGLRAVSDFEFEFQMAMANRRMFPDFEVIFFMPCEKYSFLSSSLVRELARLGGDISSFVPEIVRKKMKEKLNEMG